MKYFSRPLSHTFIYSLTIQLVSFAASKALSRALSPAMYRTASAHRKLSVMSYTKVDLLTSFVPTSSERALLANNITTSWELLPVLQTFKP